MLRKVRVLHHNICNSYLSKLINNSKLILFNQFPLLLNPVTPSSIVVLWGLRGSFPTLINVVLLNLIQITNIFEKT